MFAGIMMTTSQQVKIETVEDLCQHLGIREEQLLDYFVVKDLQDEITLYQKATYVRSDILFRMRQIRGYCDEPDKGSRYKKIRHIPKTNAAAFKSRFEPKSETPRDVASPVIWVHPRVLKPNPLNRQIYQDPEDKVFDATIKAEGIIRPIICTVDNIIVDGHRRWKRANRYGLTTIPIQKRTFRNMKLAMITLNRYRQKSDWEILQEARVLEKEFKPQAKERQVEAGKKFGVGKKLRSNLTEPISKPKVRDQVAKALQLSSGKLYQLQEIEEAINENPEDPRLQKLKRQLQNREISTHRAFRYVRSLQERMENPPPEPIDCGLEIRCRECGATYTLIHVNKGNHRLHKITVRKK